MVSPAELLESVGAVGRQSHQVGLQVAQAEPRGGTPEGLSSKQAPCVAWSETGRRGIHKRKLKSKSECLMVAGQLVYNLWIVTITAG